MEFLHFVSRPMLQPPLYTHSHIPPCYIETHTSAMDTTSIIDLQRKRRRHHSSSSSLSSQAAAWLLLMLLSCFLLATLGETERASSPVLLLDVVMPGIKTPKDYVEMFWQDGSFYEEFLKKSGDIDVSVEAWRPAPHGSSSSSSGSHAKKVRTVVTKHPVKLRIPGIPAHVKSTKSQILYEQEKQKEDKTVTVKVHETNVVEGVPFSVRFHVVLVWTATWGDETSAAVEQQQQQRQQQGGKSGGTKSNRHHQTLRLRVHQHVVYKRSFWLEKVVEKDAASETLATLQLWKLLALERVEAGPSSSSSTFGAAPLGSLQMGSVEGSGSNLGALARHILLSGLITSLLVGLTHAVALLPLVRNGSKRMTNMG